MSKLVKAAEIIKELVSYMYFYNAETNTFECKKCGSTQKNGHLEWCIYHEAWEFIKRYEKRE